MRVVSLIVLVTGCDQLFNVDHVELVPGDDARRDAPPIDAALAPDGFDLDTQCPGYELSLYPGSRYRIITTTQVAWLASDDCADDTQGVSHLAVAETRPELDVLIAALAQRAMGRWWIGAVQPITAQTVTEGWVWMNGAPVDIALWSPTEPNDGASPESDHYEQFSIIEQNFAGLIDIWGSANERALCECDGHGIATTAQIAIDQSRQ